MSELRVGLDTNVLAYAEGGGDRRRCGRARDLVARLPHDAVVVPAQVLGELYRVLVGKLLLPATEAKAAVQTWADAFAVADSTWTAMLAALELAADHGLQIWDALIMAVAAEQRCRLLLSEDFQDGFTWRGVTVVNPFVAKLNPLLASLVADGGD
jgi:predicted nucleic acid-binding protein